MKVPFTCLATVDNLCRLVVLMGNCVHIKLGHMQLTSHKLMLTYF